MNQRQVPQERSDDLNGRFVSAARNALILHKSVVVLLGQPPPLQDNVSVRDDNFANARDVRNYFERAISNQANRLGRSGSFREEDLCVLHAEDLEGASA
jgi:AAA lid domain